MRTKTKALILIVPLAVFLAETVSFPMQLNSRCKKMSCMKMMSAMNCPHKKASGEKPAGKCDKSTACSICPVCSIFVFQPPYHFSVHNDASKKNYQMRATAFVSSFTSKIWKPPNDYLLLT